MAVPRKDKAYEKHAWIILLALLVFTIALSLGGRPATPETAILLYSLAALNVLGIAVTLKPYRNGKRWAWYFLWILPAEWIGEGVFVFVVLTFFPGLAAVVFPGQSIGPSFYEFTAVFTLLSLLGLFLPYRKFFPKKQAIIP